MSFLFLGILEKRQCRRVIWCLRFCLFCVFVFLCFYAFLFLCFCVAGFCLRTICDLWVYALCMPIIVTAGPRTRSGY